MKGAIGDECVGSCLAELREALGAIFVVNLVLGNLLEVAIPFIRTKVRLCCCCFARFRILPPPSLSRTNSHSNARRRKKKARTRTEPCR